MYFFLFSENSISQLVLDETSEKSSIRENSEKPLAASSLSDSVWSYTPTNNNGEIFNSSILSSLQRASKSFVSKTIYMKVLGM